MEAGGVTHTECTGGGLVTLPNGLVTLPFCLAVASVGMDSARGGLHLWLVSLTMGRVGVVVTDLHFPSEFPRFVTRWCIGGPHACRFAYTED